MQMDHVAIGDLVRLEPGKLRYPDVGPYEVLSVHVGDEAEPASAVLKHTATGHQRREQISRLKTTNDAAG